MVPIRMGSPLAGAGETANALRSGTHRSAVTQVARKSSRVFMTFLPPFPSQSARGYYLVVQNSSSGEKIAVGWGCGTVQVEAGELGLTRVLRAASDGPA